MPKPIPGKQYTIVDEDSLSQVARRAYGNFAHWPRIYRANQSTLRSDNNPNLIYPGEVIFIPPLSEFSQDTPDMANREPDELSIVIAGIEITPTAAKVKQIMDKPSDGWTATLPWELGDNPRLDELLKPYVYPEAKVYIGGVLKMAGKLYDSNTESTETGTVKKLAGYAHTADFIDSDMTPPYEENNVTLKQRASKLVEGHGIKAVFRADTGGPFDRVTAGESESKGTHVGGLARERGVLMSNTPEGNLLFENADTKSKPVATLREGEFPLGLIAATFKGRERFGTYRIIISTPLEDTMQPVKDKRVPGSRIKTIRVKGIIAGELKVAAQWERNRAIADALTIPIPVEGWLNPRTGKVWEDNTKITLIAPSIHVPNGFDFLIRMVDFDENESKKSAILSLIPPQVYTKEEVIEPWE